MSMSAEERYMRDPVFHRLVESIYQGIADHQFTPTEVREAAMLAAIKYELRNTRRMRTPWEYPESITEEFGRVLRDEGQP